MAAAPMGQQRAAISCIACLIILLASFAADAQGVGFVGGGSVDPEQFYVGTFFETPAIARSVHVRPGVDGGWGGDLRIASINIDVIHRTDVGSGWQFYTGGGPLILITKVDPGALNPPLIRDEVTGGLAAVLGFAHPGGFLFEFKYGRARNGPSLKFGAGIKIGPKP